MKRKALLKDTLREVWRTRNRFLSILAIVALGTGFFAGLKATCPDMLLTADRYFAQTNLMDLRLVSTLGFTDDEVKAVAEKEGVRAAAPGYSCDMFYSDGDNSYVVRAYSYNQDASDDGMNQPRLLSGRLPENPGECVVETTAQTPDTFEIGNQITFTAGDAQTPLSDTLRTDTYTIVGVVDSSMYIAYERGNSTIGNGVVDTFVLLPEEDFALSVYTDLYVTLKQTEGMSAFGGAYDDTIDAAKADFEAFADAREQARYEEIVGEANEQIGEAEDELLEGEQTQRQALSDARAELDAAQREYEAGKTKYEAGLAQWQAGQSQLEAQKESVREAEAELTEKEQAYREGVAALEQAEAELNALLEQLETAPATGTVGWVSTEPAAVSATWSKAKAADAAETMDSVSVSEPSVAAAPMSAASTPALSTDGSTGATGQTAQRPGGLSQAELEQVLAEKKAQIEATRTALAQARAQLDAGWQQLSDGKAQIEAAEAALTQSRQELTAAQEELTAAQGQIAAGEQTYAAEKASSDETLEKARQEIDDARREVESLEPPTWYVFTRGDNPGYSGFEEDTGRVDAIAQVFPLFFILVAALVCFTTMTRMVEEQRTQIGTLKALGYGSGAIVGKFLWYAVSASILGSLVGLSLGMWLFPTVIFQAYGILYHIPDFVAPFRWDYALACTAAACACTALAALAACYTELTAAAASLMRPKAPKAGKRVLLERVPFIWQRLSFTLKATVRNLFRYKNRLYMTVIGIAGCTALLFAGFGLRHSISSIIAKQFDDIFHYGAAVMVDVDRPDEEIQAVSDVLAADESVVCHTRALQETVDVTGDRRTISANLLVPQDVSSLPQYITLQNRSTREPLSLLGEGVIVNEKLAKLLNKTVGEEIELTATDHTSVRLPITGITENYALNYIYLSPTLYQQTFSAAPAYNLFLANLEEGAGEEAEDALSHSLLSADAVLGTTFTSSTYDSFRNMIQSLDLVVIVLILSAGALAFIVLYNLTNINVLERLREISTLKVLGFYDGEVSAYIYRENTASALIGIVVGLIGGIFLHRFVVSTAEVDVVMFAPEAGWQSYLLAALLTMAFTLIVNFALHFKLKRVDMVASLKSVE